MKYQNELLKSQRVFSILVAFLGTEYSIAIPTLSGAKYTENINAYLLGIILFWQTLILFWKRLPFIQRFVCRCLTEFRLYCWMLSAFLTVFNFTLGYYPYQLSYQHHLPRCFWVQFSQPPWSINAFSLLCFVRPSKHTYHCK